MTAFRFAIMGAGGIAGKFCHAVSILNDCEVCAVSSKNRNRAEAFAGKFGIRKYYDSYEEMLEVEKPDCVYIAVTTNDHYRLSLLCVEKKVPVVCEKAMFQNTREAAEVFGMAKENGVFVMEAMWSRFLPAVRKVKEWVLGGRIGTIEISQFSIGFKAPKEKDNRYFSPALGGGAAKDITVYAYELTTFILNQEIEKMDVTAAWSDTGVDVNNHISITFDHALADLTASFMVNLEEKMVIYGENGKIVMPKPHFASECFLYDEKGELVEHFVDGETQNGFTYEIEEAVRCIREGSLESRVIPWKDTMACARLFDRIEETKG